MTLISRGEAGSYVYPDGTVGAPPNQQLRAELDRLAQTLGALDAATETDAPPVETFADKLRPRGGDELVPVPDEVEIDPADVGLAWDEAMPRYKGLLDTGEV